MESRMRSKRESITKLRISDTDHAVGSLEIQGVWESIRIHKVCKGLPDQEVSGLCIGMTKSGSRRIRSEEVSFGIKAHFSEGCIGNSKVQAEACRSDRNGRVVYVDWLRDGKRRGDKGIGISRRFHIVDEICLEVATDFQDGLCSRQLKKTVVLRIQRHVIEASGCDGILRELLIAGCSTTNIRGGGAHARRFRGLNGAILLRCRGSRGRCSLTWWRLDFGAFELIDFRLHFGHLGLHLIDEFSKSLCLVGRGLRLGHSICRDHRRQQKNGRNERKFLYFHLAPPGS